MFTSVQSNYSYTTLKIYDAHGCRLSLYFIKRRFSEIVTFYNSPLGLFPDVCFLCFLMFHVIFFPWVSLSSLGPALSVIFVVVYLDFPLSPHFFLELFENSQLLFVFLLVMLPSLPCGFLLFFSGLTLQFPTPLSKISFPVSFPFLLLAQTCTPAIPLQCLSPCTAPMDALDVPGAGYASAQPFPK